MRRGGATANDRLLNRRMRSTLFYGTVAHLKKDVPGVLGVHGSDLEHREASLHEEHQHSADPVVCKERKE